MSHHRLPLQVRPRSPGWEGRGSRVAVRRPPKPGEGSALSTCDCVCESGNSLCRVFPLASVTAARLQLPPWQWSRFFPSARPLRPHQATAQHSAATPLSRPQSSHCVQQRLAAAEGVSRRGGTARLGREETRPEEKQESTGKCRSLGGVAQDRGGGQPRKAKGRWMGLKGTSEGM